MGRIGERQHARCGLRRTTRGGETGNGHGTAGGFQSRRRHQPGAGGDCVASRRPEQVFAVPAPNRIQAGTAKTCSGLRFVLGRPRSEHMTLRDQIKQTRRRYSICGIAGIVTCAPPGLAAVIIKLDGTQPPEYWPLLVVLVLVGGVLFVIGWFGQSMMRCPKCRGMIGVTVSTDRYCRRCGTDFDAEV